MWWFLLGCIDLGSEAEPDESERRKDDADSDADGDSDADVYSYPTGDGRPDTDSADSGSRPSRDTVFTFSWTAEGVTLSVENPTADTYYLGMAETGTGEGWYGEDCIEGGGPNGGVYDICHDSVDARGGELATVTAHYDVVANRTTLFNDTLAAAGVITYVLYDGGDCWTFGHEPSYYSSALGCASLD